MAAYQRFGIHTLMASICLPMSLIAQSSKVPDSVVVAMSSPALFQILHYEIAGAVSGRQIVVRVELPEGPYWARVASHVLRVTNGRSPTPLDSNVLLVAVRNVGFKGDTLILSLHRDHLQLCPDGHWESTGTTYEARTRNFSGTYWTPIKVTPTIAHDAIGCQRP